MAISDILAQISGGPPKPPLSATIPPKRKADDDLSRGADKAIRRDAPTSSTPRSITTSRPTNGTSTSNGSSTLSRPFPASSTPALKTSVPRSSVSSSATPARSATSSAPPLVDAVKSEPAKAPKKGSFQEIMARAKAAQNMPKIGQITHKPVVTAREREKLNESTKKLSIGSNKNGVMAGKGGKSTPPLRDGKIGRENGKSGSRNGSRTVSAEPEKRVKKAALATTGYTGTANRGQLPLKKPATSSYGGSAYGGSARDRGRDLAPQRRDRYTYAEESEEDYESDASSDMEAGIDDVDEEEERALRFAKKEDQLALAEENRLKREKEEKRRKLAALAKNRR